MRRAVAEFWRAALVLAPTNAGGRKRAGMHGDPHLAPGSAEYEEHVRGELEHYAGIFAGEAGRERLVQPVPPSWGEAERRAMGIVRDATGATATEHVLKVLMARPGVRMLSLGSGPGGVEIS